MAREARLDLDRKIAECRAESSEEDFGPAEAAELMAQTGKIAESVSGAAAELVARIGRMAR
ncbi:hypothetical protein Afil01_44300 [Actinorhabdospora filicis]|uniref:Uncharacterized protein n=1 Tax=Actinorhabdospora filicis TaxID=1785913 RepID=A0A9W6SNT0_9ACTN|nr:hypothetical protein [Actinorhabdospora filicis]GLZ79623.1 hypothetical protein Afil01_44300 [Actinorhabdospora filicis]